MREHDWKIYADSAHQPINKLKKNQFDSNLEHIYSQGKFFKPDDERDFNNGTWYAECTFCGMKSKIINGKPLLWGKFLDCEEMFAIHGIATIINS